MVDWIWAEGEVHRQVGRGRKKPVSLVPKGKKSYFVGKATAEALEEYLPLAEWQIQIETGFYMLLGLRSNMLSMKVLWEEWWWKSACLSLICKRVKKPLMVVLQIFIDLSCSVLCFFLLLMKYALKGALLNTVSASMGWEACRILNVLWLNFVTLKLHRDIYEPYCVLIWNEPRKVLLLLWDWNFSLYELWKSCWTPEFKVILQMLISPGIFGTLEKTADDFYILHLFFFAFGKMFLPNQNNIGQSLRNIYFFQIFIFPALKSNF